MALPAFETNLNIIQQLDDEPNDVGGLTSAQLKAKFDEAGNAIKDYINNDLIPAILAAAATEAERTAAEASRVYEESLRAAAETARAQAEEQRAANENARNSWGEYSAAAEYAVGNKVSSGGSSYVCIKPCKGVAPPDASYWQLIAQRGNDGNGVPTDELPLAPGVASAGNAKTYSRGDHRHPKELPNGGKAGQVLTKTEDGEAWADGEAGSVNVPSTTSLIKGDGSGGLVAATRGSDYIASGNIVKQTLVASETTPTENYAINWVYG